MPVSGGGSSRVALEDITVKGYDNITIKKGSMVMFRFYSSQHQGSAFDEPNKFNPHRFLDPKVLEKARKDKKLVPFSAGKRDCIGKRFAMMEMKIVLMILLRNYRFELISEPEVVMDLTIHAKDGIWMRAIKQ